MHIMNHEKENSMKRQKKLTSRDRLVEELHAPARRNFPRRRVIVWRYDNL